MCKKYPIFSLLQNEMQHLVPLSDTRKKPKTVAEITPEEAPSATTATNEPESVSTNTNRNPTVTPSKRRMNKAGKQAGRKLVPDENSSRPDENSDSAAKRMVNEEMQVYKMENGTRSE